MKRRAQQQGFTLLEATLVLLLLVVTAGWVASSARSWIDRYRLLQTTRGLVTDLQAARQQSVLTGISHGIIPEEPGFRYAIVRSSDTLSLRATALPAPVGLRGPDIWFHPRGNAAPAGSLRVESGEHSMRVIVAASGRVRWEVLP